MEKETYSTYASNSEFFLSNLNLSFQKHFYIIIYYLVFIFYINIFN